MKNCSPWEVLTLEKDCLLCVGPHAGTGEESEEERVGETMCDELTAAPIPHVPALLIRGVKLSPGRREGWGEDVLVLFLIIQL